MTGNIVKIRAKFLENPAAFSTLQAIIIAEKDLGKKRVATEGLLWLLRGLQFTSQALRRNIDTPKEELSASFQGAYSNTLAKHHSFMIKPIFSVLVIALIHLLARHESMSVSRRFLREAWTWRAGKGHAAIDRVAGCIREDRAYSRHLLCI
jgi:hypothetical protein